MAYFSAFVDSAPLVASLMADPHAWARCTSSTLGSAATAWVTVTSAPTFHDLALSSINKPAYIALTGSDGSCDNSLAKPVPLISNLASAAGKHAQRAFHFVLLKHSFNQLVHDTSLDVNVRCRFQQAAMPGAGRFQTVIPDRTKYLELNDREYMVNWCWRYGLPQRLLKDKRCADGCRQFGRGMRFDPGLFEDGVHSLNCHVDMNLVWRRHQAMLSELEAFATSELKAVCSRKETACHFSDDGRVDTMMDRPHASSGREGVDVTVVNTLSPSYVSEAAALDGAHALKSAVDAKEKRHREQCTAAGHGYYSAVFTVFGAVHGDFNSKLVVPHFRYLKKTAKANGEDEWAVQALHDRYLDRWSVIIARFNAKAIEAAVHRESPCGTPCSPVSDHAGDGLPSSPAHSHDSGATQTRGCSSPELGGLWGAHAAH